MLNMSKIDKETAKEYQHSPTDFLNSDDCKTTADDQMDSREDFVEFLKKLRKSTWLCEVAEA
jgi:hypothetical protein